MKATLRQEYLLKRAVFPVESQLEAAFDCVEHFPQIDVMGLSVGGYFAINNELDPRPLMMALKRKGARLALPVPTSDGLIFRELTRENELVKVGFNTYAPPETALLVTPDILLLPLVAFDKVGGRLGYGKGYYDRYLSENKPLKIGVGYAMQEAKEIPLEKHDARLDYVLTEKRLIKANDANSFLR